MIDIDCHERGTVAGALAFAEHLRANPLFGDDLYVESSTNGVGVHGYVVVVKGCAGDRITNVALKVLDLYLKGLSYLGDFDIELVEVKGTCPELTWGLSGDGWRSTNRGNWRSCPARLSGARTN